MPCDPQILRQVPLFALFDDEELGLAEQVEREQFRPRRRIYKIGDPAGRAYVVVSASSEFFGFASMLERTPHQTSATAVDDTTCLIVDRDDILALLRQKPHAGMDMLTVP